MEDVQICVLTITNYSTEDEEAEDAVYTKSRVTVAPGMIDFVIAGYSTYAMSEGRELRKVNVILTSGSNLELLVSEVDMLSIERAAGTYVLPA